MHSRELIYQYIFIKESILNQSICMYINIHVWLTNNYFANPNTIELSITRTIQFFRLSEVLSSLGWLPVEPFLPWTPASQSCSICHLPYPCLRSVSGGCPPWTDGPLPCTSLGSAWPAFLSHYQAHLNKSTNLL